MNHSTHMNFMCTFLTLIIQPKHPWHSNYKVERRRSRRDLLKVFSQTKNKTSLHLFPLHMLVKAGRVHTTYSIKALKASKTRTDSNIFVPRWLSTIVNFQHDYNHWHAPCVVTNSKTPPIPMYYSKLSCFFKINYKTYFHSMAKQWTKFNW